jgi:hypothetical protein
MNPVDDSDLLLSELADYICPVSGELMHDPVIADDGHSYERASIEGWFRACQDRQLQITSPWTRAPMSRNLRDNIDLKRRIAAAVHERSFVTGLEGLSSIHVLNAVFAQLDPLRDILAETLDGWRPPQLVVIGAESSGKSSLLERLVMMPILPTAEGICTRLPIHVRLRNMAQAQAPRLEVYSLVNNRTEEGPFDVPMQSGALDVRDKMQEVLQREHGRVEGVSADRIIILHVHGPHVPSLDVVDMPGLIAAPAGLREQTRALIDRQVERDGACSMYLAVVPAGQRPNTSIAMEVVQSKGLEGRTLGVFTKCDDVSVRGLASLRRLVGEAPDAALGGVALAPHGWYATMCAPLEGGAGESNAARLRRQAAAEEAFFAEHMPEEAAAGRATSGALVQGLSGMFLQHVRTGWAPATLRRLEAALETARREDAALGLPALAGRSAEEVARAQRLAAVAVRANIERVFGEAGQACCREVLEPLKRRLAGLVRSEGAAVRAEEAADAWAAEAGEVLDACREAAGRWREWWVGRARELVVGEGAGADGRCAFGVERFPAYVEAVLVRGAAAASAAAARAEAAAAEAVARFYDDASPWARFTSDLGAAPATVRVQRDVGQLVERVVVAFLRGGRALREGLAGAAEAAAGEVRDWAEGCGEERRRLADRMERIEAAKAGVVRGLGAASDEELMAAAAVCATALWYWQRLFLQ